MMVELKDIALTGAVALMSAIAFDTNAQNFEWKGTKCTTINSCFDKRNNDYFHNSRMIRNEMQNRIYGRNSYRWNRDAGKEQNSVEIHRIQRTPRTVGGSGSRIYKWNRTQ